MCLGEKRRRAAPNSNVESPSSHNLRPRNIAVEDVLPHWADLDEERYKAAQDGEDEQSDHELDTRIDLVTRALGSADDKQYKSNNYSRDRSTV